MSAVTIVIPCYNEENRLPIKEYEEHLSSSNVNFVFVDDGSTDKTLLVLQELQRSYPKQVHLIHMHMNVGKAEAVRIGMLKIPYSDANDIIGFMDADLATPFDEIPYFLEAFARNNVDFAFGSRISRIGAKIKRYNYRHYFGRIIATSISIYLKIPIYDSQCGAKFFHAHFANQIFMEPFKSRWLFDVEIFKRIGLMGIDVEECACELPLHTWIEKKGSKIRFRDLISLPLEFIKIIRHYKKQKTLYSRTDLQYSTSLRIFTTKETLSIQD